VKTLTPAYAPTRYFSQRQLLCGYGDPRTHEHLQVQRATEGHGSTGHGQYEYPDCHVPPGSVCFANAVVKISPDLAGDPAWYVYKLGDYDMCRDAYPARWAD
jgi:hypothetical protein